MSGPPRLAPTCFLEGLRGKFSNRPQKEGISVYVRDAIILGVLFVLNIVLFQCSFFL